MQDFLHQQYYYSALSNTLDPMLLAWSCDGMKTSSCRARRRRSVVAPWMVPVAPSVWEKGLNCTWRCWTCAANACWHCMWQTPCLAAICGKWFWTKFHQSQAFSWLCHTILHGLFWMKVCTNKDLGVNSQRCRLPTYPLIWLLLGSMSKDTALRMKSFRWLGLQNWQGWLTNLLHWYKVCQTAFAPSVLTVFTIRTWTKLHFLQAFKVWLLDMSSIRSWTKLNGLQAFKVWLLDFSSIRAWTKLHGLQAFKA